MGHSHTVRQRASPDRPDRCPSSAGVCRFCGCSEEDACIAPLCHCGFGVPCSWTDRTQSVCSACAPAAKAEAIALKTLVKAGYRSERPGIKAPLDFVQAFHQGFVVGWFSISARSAFGRNPWPPMPHWAPKHNAWNLGQRRGAEASRVYQSACGPLTNAPRKEVLSGRR
jgi:hypothetical protein